MQFRNAHFTLRHRLTAAISHRLDNITYTQRHGLIRGMKRKGGLGFLPAMLARVSDESPEHRFLRSLDLEGRVVYEIGAFQGVLTLFLSGRAAEVVTYEPNPASYARVMDNLRLNGRTNVRVRTLAIGERAGSTTLLYDPLMPGAASGEERIAGQIRDSGRGTRAVEVQVVSLDDDIASAGLPAPHLIKIDIEGMELPALRGMTRTLERYRPDLYMEVHGATAEHKEQNVRALVEFLSGAGYTDILHVESGERIGPANAVRAGEGHLYCRAGARAA